MIKVRNLSYKYVSKNRETLALSDISISFPNSGMVFLTGKSGSGKSTFLNILAGLDKIQTGDVLIDNNSMKKFKNTDYDLYRNNYAGIIFQDHNLIDTFTVYENIELALRLQERNVNKNKISDVLMQVGLAGFENSLPNELSGGERQRVAVARQLAKGCKVLLADEPTGSLDSQNSQQVLDLLKELSKDILVIVVSHDDEAAFEFSDRIITLSDGRIIGDTHPERIINTDTEKLPGKKRTLSNKYLLKLSLNAINAKLGRLIMSILLSVIAAVLFGFFYMFTNYDSEKTLAHTLIDNKIQYTKLLTSNTINNEPTYPGNGTLPLSTKVIKFLEGNKNNFLKQIDVSNRFSIREYSSLFYDSEKIAVYDEDLLQSFGFELDENSLVLEEDSIYITDYYADGLISLGYKILNFDDTQTELTINNKPTDLIGKRVINSDDQIIKIQGIIYTRYKEKYGDVRYLDSNGLLYKEFQFFRDAFLNTFYVNTDYIKKQFNNKTFINLDDNLKFQIGQNLTSRFTLNRLNSEFVFIDSAAVVTEDGYFQDLENLQLADNEVIISLSLYNKIFGEDKAPSYYLYSSASEGKREIKFLRTPKHINDTLYLEIKINDEVFRNDSFVLKGVYIDLEIFPMPDFVFVSPNLLQNILEKYTPWNALILNCENDINDLYKTLEELKEFNVLANGIFSEEVYNFEGSYNTLKYIFFGFCIIMLIFAGILFSNFITISILNRKKEIGIIRSLGGSSNDILKLFSYESLLIAFIVLIATFVFVFLGAFILNRVLSAELIVFFPFLFVDIKGLILITALVALAVTISTAFPILKASRSTPMDLIKSL